MKTCTDCGKALSRVNVSGFCRSCFMTQANRDPAVKAKQFANRDMTPAREAALVALNSRDPVPLSVRFAAKCSRPTEAGCIEWTGAHDRHGYGRIAFDGKDRQATHAALILAGKPRPSPKHFALHRCDNPPCVNPDHLWWGTQGDNMQDCAAKGRVNERGLSFGRNIRLANCARKRAA